jgi:hypothetical protein
MAPGLLACELVFEVGQIGDMGDEKQKLGIKKQTLY